MLIYTKSILILKRFKNYFSNNVHEWLFFLINATFDIDWNPKAFLPVNKHIQEW